MRRSPCLGSAASSGAGLTKSGEWERPTPPFRHWGDGRWTSGTSSPREEVSGRAAGARRRSGGALSVSLRWSLPLLLGTGLLLGSLALTLLFLLLLLGEVLLALLVLILGSGQFGSFQI